MLTGCEADSSLAPFPNEGEEPVEVRFHATTIEANVEVSRANYVEQGLETDDRIGICNEWYNNIKLIYTEGETPNLSIENNGKIYYPYQTTEMKVCAYAPYIGTTFDSDKQTVKVKSEWATSAGLDDYITDPLWAKATVTKTNTQANFGFMHQMARLKIYLVHNSQKEYTAHNITFIFDRLQYGEMFLQTGKIESAAIGDADYHESCSSNHTLVSKTNTAMPQYDHTVISGSTLKQINIKFKDETTSYTNSYTINTTFNESGKIYTLIINFEAIENDEYTKKELLNIPNE